MNGSSRWVATIAFFCALLSAAGVKAQTQTQTYIFGAASYTAPGINNSTSPQQGNLPIATADFNGDGIPDVVMLGTNSSGQALSICWAGRTERSLRAWIMRFRLRRAASR